MTEKDYDDIPGTFVFDADRSREGYWLNQFCISLRLEKNRQAFRDELPNRPLLDVGIPEIASRGVLEEQPQLDVKGLVKMELTP